MLNVSQFIADHITGRQKSMFAADIEANRDKLRAEIEGKRVLVIGGAGTIGSSYIRAAAFPAVEAGGGGYQRERSDGTDEGSALDVRDVCA